MQDAICVFVFRAWMTSFNTSSTPGTNHTLMLSLQPELDQGKFIKIDIQTDAMPAPTRSGLPRTPSPHGRLGKPTLAPLPSLHQRRQAANTPIRTKP